MNQEPVGSSLVALETSRLPITPQFAQKLGVTSTQWRVLIDQIFPSAKSIEAITMAITYCKARNLDIFKRPIHIVPVWSSVLGRMTESVWAGISEIRTTATRTKQYAGIAAVEFGPEITHTFEGKIEKWIDKKKQLVDVVKTIKYPEWASVVVYRMIDGQKCEFHAKIYWIEAYARMGKTDIPNEMWEKRPRGQLDKCVEAAALRKAFPEEIGGELTADEMEGQVVDHGGAVIEHAAQPASAASRVPPPAEVKKPAPAQTKAADPKPAESKAKPAGEKPAVQQQKPAEDEITDIDPVTGEIIEDGDTVGAGDAGDAGAAPGASDSQDAEEETLGDFFERMDAAMSMAFSEADVEEVWSDFDPLAKFANDDSDDNQSLAKSIRRRHMSRVAPKG